MQVAALERTTRPIRLIEPELVFQMLRSGRKVILLDVRRPEELSDGTIPGAQTCPPERIDCHRAELVVVVSEHGGQARRAAHGLAEAGFPEVTVLEGGMTHWRDLGYPVAR